MSILYLKTDCLSPLDDSVVGPDEDVDEALVAISSSVLELITIKVQELEALDAVLQTSSVEAVHQLQLRPEVLLGQMVQHPGVHKALHESCPVLGQP